MTPALSPLPVPSPLSPLCATFTTTTSTTITTTITTTTNTTTTSYVGWLAFTCNFKPAYLPTCVFTCHLAILSFFFYTNTICNYSPLPCPWYCTHFYSSSFSSSSFSVCLSFTSLANSFTCIPSFHQLHHLSSLSLPTLNDFFFSLSFFLVLLHLLSFVVSSFSSLLSLLPWFSSSSPRASAYLSSSFHRILP